MTTNFHDISYLNTGSPIQRKGYEALKKLGALDVLKKYDATLVGTLPIDIFIESSDLDIICFVEDFKSFSNDVIQHFSSHQGFKIFETNVNGVSTIIAHFHAEGFDFELFAQAMPIEKQAAYRHMVVEENILRMKGNKFKDEIIALKKSGLKTEPAFAELLGLDGDPYDALLAYSI